MDKLLGDLLKTTEGFQKLKKINEDLKVQVNSGNHYVRTYSFKVNLNSFTVGALEEGQRAGRKGK